MTTPATFQAKLDRVYLFNMPAESLRWDIPEGLAVLPRP